MKKIVFASQNEKKVAEIKRMANGMVEIVSLADIPEVANFPQVEENGTTFYENALIKATYWSQRLKMPVIAEDSGIEIEALDGYPGVQTKRCIEELLPGANINVDNPSDLYPRLLKLMQESDNPSTKAAWICAIAFVDSKNTTAIQSYLHGNMCECAGENVFGFDQYFKPLGYNCTLSELGPSTKDKIGPRGKCYKIIVKQLEESTIK